MADLPYPTRSRTHIQERLSRRHLDNVLPDNWIPREISERDYGVDGLLEIVHEDKLLRGEMVFVQLKSSDEPIPWTDENTAVESGIKTSTASYWLSFAVPVFLCLVDLANGEVFYANAKKQARQQYALLKKRKSISFYFSKDDQLTKTSATDRFYKAYKRENRHKEVLSNVSDLLLHYQTYADALIENIGKDFHLPLEPREEALMYHIWLRINSAFEFLDEDPMPIPYTMYESHNSFYSKSTGHEECYHFFAENISVWLLSGLAYLLPKLGPATLKESDYWHDADYLLRSHAIRESDVTLNDWIDGLRRDCPPLDLLRANSKPSPVEYRQACAVFKDTEQERIAFQMLEWAEIEVKREKAKQPAGEEP